VIVWHSWIYNYLCNQCLSPLTLWVRVPLMRGVLDTTLYDRVCQWLATGRWFSLCTIFSSINKTDRHDITELLLKPPFPIWKWQWMKWQSFLTSGKHRKDGKRDFIKNGLEYVCFYKQQCDEYGTFLVMYFSHINHRDLRPAFRYQ
jgi:hypothetical protein